jgi:ribA/ribD-fused uncharacterized protein
MKIINRFVGDHSFLNNFFPSTIYVEGISYPTVEHAYQAHKTQDSSTRELIRCAKSPMIAKKLGRAILLPENWSLIKVDLMRKFIKLKFENPILREMLLSTSDFELVQENMWNDRFWGTSKGVGENWLGKILMEVRDEIRSEKLADVVLDNFD